MDLTNNLKRNERVTWRVLEGDCILLHLDSGVYYTLNSVGRFLWESLDGKRSLADIQEAMLDRYEADAERVKGDLLEILEDLVKEDLVKSDG
jgi:hypothetical protein